MKFLESFFPTTIPVGTDTEGLGIYDCLTDTVSEEWLRRLERTIKSVFSEIVKALISGTNFQELLLFLIKNCSNPIILGEENSAARLNGKFYFSIESEKIIELTEELAKRGIALDTVEGNSFQENTFGQLKTREITLDQGYCLVTLSKKTV